MSANGGAGRPAESPPEAPAKTPAKKAAELAGGLFFLTAVLGISGAIFDIESFRTIRFVGLAMVFALLLVAGVLKLRENRTSA
jgi:hypothetical protein